MYNQVDKQDLQQDLLLLQQPCVLIQNRKNSVNTQQHLIRSIEVDKNPFYDTRDCLIPTN